jgi:hypothetical protein
MAFIDAGGAIRLHNVYSGHNINLSPLSAEGFDPVRLTGKLEFMYNHIRMELLKVAIARPPAKSFGYKDYIVIAVFDKAIAVNTGLIPAVDRWQIMSPATLAPYLYEDVIYIAGRVCAITTGRTCFVWDPQIYGISVKAIQCQ